MRVFIFIPPHTEIFWLRVTARILSSKYPGSVIVGPTTCGMARQLQKHSVAIIDPPPPRSFDTSTLTGRVVAKLHGIVNKPWDQMRVCDMVMMIWDGSPSTIDSFHRATSMGKRVVIIRMVE